MYILIDFTKYYGGRRTMAYENFKDLKDSVISKLDSRGWNDKKTVNLRSVKSCIEYLTRDAWNVDFKLSKSHKKFNEYRYGEKAMNL